MGVDRSGPPPPQTLPGAPLNLWTIPNAIGMVRLGLLPIFLVVSFSSDSGIGVWPAVLFGVAGWSDYFDGIAARVTGQYSRFGTLLDPVVDRLLVLCGVIACWYHDLLPRWALAILVARELFMLIAGRYAMRRGVGDPRQHGRAARDLAGALGARVRLLRSGDPEHGPLLHRARHDPRGHRDVRSRRKTLNLSLSVRDPLVCSAHGHVS